MMGIFTRPGTKIIWLRYRKNGKTVRESSGTADPAQARKILEEKLKRLNEPSMTFREAVVLLFETAALRSSTRRRYITSAKAWHPLCANLHLRDIDVDLIRNFVLKRKQAAVSDGGVRRDLAFMSSLFSYMMELPNGPKSNPFLTFNKKRLKEKKRTRFLTEGEFEKLLAGCTTDMQRSILTLAVETGLRSGELKALTWDRIDLRRRQLYVVESKTGVPRTVPLSEKAMGTLLGTPRSTVSHVFWYLDWRSPQGTRHAGGTNKVVGQPARFITFNNFWRAAVRRAGLPDLRFHDLRHTFASWWMQRGGSEAALQHILGHTSMAMTARYRHLRTIDLHREMRTTHGEFAALQDHSVEGSMPSPANDAGSVECSAASGEGPLAQAC
jgi:integrase